MPVPFTKTASGTILVNVAAASNKRTALYARVSSHDQKNDLERQLGRLAAYASKNSLDVVAAVSDVGSAMNGTRNKLIHLLKNPDIDIIVVEHRDRLTRFGADYIEATLSASKRQLIVVEKEELEDDLVRDMTEVLTSFCARLYGKRSAKNKAAAALLAMNKNS